MFCGTLNLGKLDLMIWKDFCGTFKSSDWDGFCGRFKLKLKMGNVSRRAVRRQKERFDVFWQIVNISSWGNIRNSNQSNAITILGTFFIWTSFFFSTTKCFIILYFWCKIYISSISHPFAFYTLIPWMFSQRLS